MVVGLAGGEGRSGQGGGVDVTGIDKLQTESSGGQGEEQVGVEKKVVVDSRR